MPSPADSERSDISRRRGKFGRFISSSRWTRAVVFLSQLPLLGLLLCVFVLILVTTFYERFFLPCMQCYDFEASVAHEVGHVLGLSHPDLQLPRNLKLDSDALHDLTQHVTNSSACLYPLRHVTLDPEPTETATAIMYSLTRHRIRTCLTEDDFTALHALYPTCEAEDATTPPACVKPRQAIGYLRLIIATVVPYLFATLVAMFFQQLVKAHYRQRLRDLTADVDRLRQSESHSSEQVRELHSSVESLELTQQELEANLALSCDDTVAAREETIRAKARVTELEASCQHAVEKEVTIRAALDAERKSHCATRAEMMRVAAESTQPPAPAPAAPRPRPALPSRAGDGRAAIGREPRARSALGALSARLSARRAADTDATDAGSGPAPISRRLLTTVPENQRLSRERARMEQEEATDSRMDERDSRRRFGERAPSAARPGGLALASRRAQRVGAIVGQQLESFRGRGGQSSSRSQRGPSMARV